MLHPNSRGAHCLASLLVLMCGIGALADPISDPVLTITATNAEGSGSAYVYFADLVLQTNSSYKYTAGLIDLGDAGAAIQNLTLIFQPGTSTRQVTMNYVGLGGVSDTTFTLSTGLMSFYPMTIGTRGKASVTIGCTDNNGNGAWLRAINYQTGHGIFTSDYNGLVPSGTQFDNLVNEVTAGAGGSNSVTANDPSPGWRNLGVTISSMSTQSAFTLSAGDKMSGQTQFLITPEPTSIGLLGLGVVVLLRRRR